MYSPQLSYNYAQFGMDLKYISQIKKETDKNASLFQNYFIY